MSAALVFSLGAAAPCGTDPDLFFGPDGETTTERERRERKAKAVCAGCPARPECMAWFRASGAQHGVWAGIGETDRAGKPGERPCSGPCGLIKPPGAFPRHGGVCKPCLGDQMRKINQRRRQQVAA